MTNATDPWATFVTPIVDVARAAYANGDGVLQVSVPIVSDAWTSAALSAVCREGWELLSGSQTFVPEGQRFRGIARRNTHATVGRTTGCYLFRRA